MTRRHFQFECEGSMLSATMDLPDDTSGANTALLIVSAGNFPRCGAWSSMAQLADRIAVLGYPVMRFDRRGVGDSDGPYVPVTSASPDVQAALTTLRGKLPHIDKIIGFGNQDAADALIASGGTGMDGLILANPWACSPRQDASENLSHPMRMRMTGQRGIKRFLKRLLVRKPARERVAGRNFLSGLAKYDGKMAFLAAEHATDGQSLIQALGPRDTRLRICPKASADFVEAPAREWLVAAVLDALKAA